MENIIFFMTGLVAGVGICVSIFNLYFISNEKKKKEEKGGPGRHKEETPSQNPIQKRRTEQTEKENGF